MIRLECGVGWRLELGAEGARADRLHGIASVVLARLPDETNEALVGRVWLHVERLERVIETSAALRASVEARLDIESHKEKL